ncbi:MAG: GNAT family N-acetyltransferase [Alphaproteobacteria bacterium]|nr:GNAT family N-acetyltransferase [Alphaproteobacteria bacterium]
MNRVRPALIADAPAIARIDIETWRASYAGLLPDKYLVSLREAERQRLWASDVAQHPGDVMVAVDAAGRVRGFGSCGRARDAVLGCTGEIFTLYVAPDHQGAGRGRAVVLALFARLLQRRHGSALVWVLRGNPSRFFYERVGGTQIAQRRIPFAGASLEAVAYGWHDLAGALKAQARAGGRLSGES